MHPIVLLDPPGGDFWPAFLDFARKDLVEKGYVSGSDLDLFKLTDDVEAAAREISDYYRNFHSMRYVSNRLVMRLARAPDNAAIAKLATDFADIIATGTIERVEAAPVEVQDDDALDSERIAFRFDRASYGRLRAFIDTINEL
jgi:hypothetical protein